MSNEKTQVHRTLKRGHDGTQPTSKAQKQDSSEEEELNAIQSKEGFLFPAIGSSVTPPNSTTPTTSTGSPYGGYYKDSSSGESLYAKQYNDELITAEKALIRNTIKTQVESGKNEITILDYGAGDGRAFSTFLEIAAKHPDITFKIVALDPSFTGLHKYRNRLKNQAFEEIKTPTQPLHEHGENAAGYISELYKSDNIQVQFVHTHTADNVDHIQDLLKHCTNEQPFDVCFCLFGVLSCIPGRKNRQAVLKMFNDLTDPNGSVALTLPARSRFAEDQKLFQSLQERYKADPKKLQEHFADITEPGDIYYKKEVEDETGAPQLIELFYHIYNSHDLYKDMTEAGLKYEYAKISNVANHLKLAGRPGWQAFDYGLTQAVNAFSYYLPATASACITDSMSSYISCTCTPTRQKEQDPPTKVSSSSSQHPTKLTKTHQTV